MKLPIPSFGKKIKSEYYLSLLLRDEKACAVVLEEQLGKLKIISSNEEPFTASVEDASLEELLDVLDKTISRAEETLPADVEMEKTVFGVKEEWVEEKKIKKDYLGKLKKVCDGLGLSPIGFLVITEAIAHLIQEEEGAPVSAILVEVGKKSVRVSLLRAGKIVNSIASEIITSVQHTVDTVLKHFLNVEVLPSRIILFDDGSEEKIAQEFISKPWSKSLPFLHMPQISILPHGFDAKAIVFGAATQLGLDVLGPLGEHNPEEIKTFETKSGIPEKQKPDKDQESPSYKPIEEDNKSAKGGSAFGGKIEEKTDVKNAKITEGDNFGFVVGEDISDVSEKAVSAEKESVEKTPEVLKPKIHHYVSESLSHPSSEKIYAVAQKRENLMKHQQYANQHVSRGEGEGLETNSTRPFFLLGIVSGFKSAVTSIFDKSPIRLGGRTTILFFIFIFILLVSTFLYFFKLGANVTLNIQPKDAGVNEKIILSTSESSDTSKNVIGASKVSTSLNGSVTIPTTGKKETGNKAKGTVTIYNNSDAKKQLSVGTVVTSSNSLDYTLDKDVTIASASGDIFSGTKPGTQQAAITARNIGNEYNIPSGTKFTIGSSSLLAAKNDSAFSGGTKKEITVVSKKDISSLLSKLPDSLSEKANNNLQNDADSDTVIAPFFLNITIDTKNFDKELDDEAKQVTLKGKVTFDSLAYQKRELASFAQSLLKSKYNQNGTIPEKSITNTLSDLKKKDESEVTANLSIKADLLPKLDLEKIKKEIVGLSFDDANQILNNLQQVSSTSIVLRPNIPFLPKILPKITSNITLTIHTP